MIIAFTAMGDTLETPLDRRFGRAAKFLLYDSATAAITILDNAPNLNAAQGAGVQAAAAVARAGAAVLVTGHCGPKAFQVLRAAGIKIFTSTAPTVAAALAQYQAGELTEADAADSEAHWT
jgi:predicted Fe-Mo cluster-binding NifX family protein